MMVRSENLSWHVLVHLEVEIFVGKGHVWYMFEIFVGISRQFTRTILSRYVKDVAQ